MVSFVQSVVPGSRFPRQCSGLAALAFALLAGGCSADIARFDFASANLNDTTTGAIPTPPATVKGRSNLLGEANPDTYGGTPAARSEGGAYYPAHGRPAPSSGVSSAPLSDMTPPAGPAAQAAAPAPAPTQMAALTRETPRAQAAPVMADHAEVSRGDEIEVKEGDTLYGLSRRHQVSINDMMSVNGLKTANLKPGQKLYLPKTQVTQKAVPHTLPVVSGVASAAVPSAPAPQGWEGSHTVQPGESLYGLAVRYRTKAVDIQRYNGIQDVRRVKPGVVLRVPGTSAGGASQAVAAQTAIDTPASAPVAAPAAPQASQPAAGAPSNILNAGERVAVANPAGSANDATPAPSATGTAAPKLRWPVEGKIIKSFGRSTDGIHNDGINLAAPQGTDIHAAEAGTVAYSGGDLKGYGNLILVRHDNGWVTAYAHADELLVQRGDVVKRGQVIAKAGKSGQVDQPQVHFELRQGQKPVDPAPYMEKM